MKINIFGFTWVILHDSVVIVPEKGFYKAHLAPVWASVIEAY